MSAIHRLSWVVDIEAYGRRVHRAHADAQDRLNWAVTQTLLLAGVNPMRCDRQERGDGLLLILPPAIDQPRTVPTLVTGLRDALREANRVGGEAGRIRLRSALAQGIVESGSTGFRGQSVILACYLLDSTPAHEALSQAPDSDLMVIVSDDLHRDLFAQGFTARGLPAFYSVKIDRPEKGFTATGWIQVPGPGRTDPKLPTYSPGGTTRTPEQRRRDAIFAAIAVAGGIGGGAGTMDDVDLDDSAENDDSGLAEQYGAFAAIDDADHNEYDHDHDNQDHDDHHDHLEDHDYMDDHNDHGHDEDHI